MSQPLLSMNVEQIREMMDQYHAALDGAVDEFMDGFNVKIKEILKDAKTTDISRMTGVYDMAVKNLKNGEIGNGVGLGAAVKVLTHMGYKVEITISKR